MDPLSSKKLEVVSTAWQNPFRHSHFQVQRQGCSALRAISLAPNGGLGICLEVGLGSSVDGELGTVKTLKMW